MRSEYVLMEKLSNKVATLKEQNAELLEALQRLLGCMSLAGWEGDPSAEFARAAIKKATGENNK